MKKILIAVYLSVLFVTGAAQEIAITFDDAPTGDSELHAGRQRTDLLITQLKKAGVEEAAFFVITQQLNEEGRARLEAYSKAGHLIANHTNTHRWIHRIGLQDYLNDITVAHGQLKEMNGFIPYFRYPFLDEGRTRPVRDSIRTHLISLGLQNGYVTIDNYDWYINTLVNRAVKRNAIIDYDKLRTFYIEHIWNSIRFYDNIAMRTLGRSPKHVLLLHENDLAAMFTADLIDFLMKQQWKIISPLEAYTDPIASIIPDVLFNGQGRVGAIAFSKGIPARELVQESEDEAWLENEMTARGIIVDP